MVRIGKNLSDTVPIRNGLKQEDVQSPLLYNFALEYAISAVQVNQYSLKLNGTYLLLIYVDDVNMLGGSTHTIKENAEALVVTSKETELEVRVDKTKHMAMSRDQDAGRIHNISLDNRSLEVQIFGNNIAE
jgi:transcriptional antiterminator Rof (Rho-off)